MKKWRVFFDEDNEWYGAKVTKLQKEGGKVQVVWDDDDGQKYDLEPGYIRKKISNVDRNGPFQAGEAVMAYCSDDDSVYPGIIQTENEDGSFTVLWDEDGSECKCNEAEMRKVAPMLDEGDLEVGMKVRGQITNMRDFGAFCNFGAFRDGLIHIANQKQPDMKAPPFLEGDKVSAYYAEDEEWYDATINEKNDDGTYSVSWDEDGDEPENIKEKEIKLLKRPAVKVNQILDVWISKVDDGKIGLSMFEGGKRPAVVQDLSAFKSLDPDTFINGKVVSIKAFGIFVEVENEGMKAQGLVHISQIKDSFCDDPWQEVEDGQDVQVRVIRVDDEGRLKLSMRSPGSGDWR